MRRSFSFFLLDVPEVEVDIPKYSYQQKEMPNHLFEEAIIQEEQKMFLIVFIYFGVFIFFCIVC